MKETEAQSSVLEGGDGRKIPLMTWLPAGPPRGVIQVLHGLGEYAARYDRFAALANADGFVLAAHDHRGHGGHGEYQAFFATRRGWQAVVDDVGVVHARLLEAYPELPVVLLGHSMGSYIAQAFVIEHTPRLAGLLLSASNWASRLQLYAVLGLAQVEKWRLGEHGRSALLHQAGFGKFNRPFRPARTEMDWLSRDPAEVDRYVADPLCGGPYSTSLWMDLAAGLLDITRDAALQRIPADLPIMISGGEADPVGGDRGMTRLAMHYAQTGHQRLAVKIYPEGRHEMLNETNRDAVSRDWLDWIAASSDRVRAAKA